MTGETNLAIFRQSRLVCVNSHKSCYTRRNEADRLHAVTAIVHVLRTPYPYLHSGQNAFEAYAVQYLIVILLCDRQELGRHLSDALQIDE